MPVMARVEHFHLSHQSQEAPGVNLSQFHQHEAMAVSKNLNLNVPQGPPHRWEVLSPRLFQTTNQMLTYVAIYLLVYWLTYAWTKMFIYSYCKTTTIINKLLLSDFDCTITFEKYLTDLPKILRMIKCLSSCLLDLTWRDSNIETWPRLLRCIAFYGASLTSDDDLMVNGLLKVEVKRIGVWRTEEVSSFYWKIIDHLFEADPPNKIPGRSSCLTWADQRRPSYQKGLGPWSAAWGHRPPGTGASGESVEAICFYFVPGSAKLCHWGNFEAGEIFQDLSCASNGSRLWKQNQVDDLPQGVVEIQARWARNRFEALFRSQDRGQIKAFLRQTLRSIL